MFCNLKDSPALLGCEMLNPLRRSPRVQFRHCEKVVFVNYRLHFYTILNPHCLKANWKGSILGSFQAELLLEHCKATDTKLLAVNVHANSVR
jgi:hypothetical protein